MNKEQIIGKTIIGSHMWNMNHKNSDVDYFTIYKVSTYQILTGAINPRSVFKTTDKEDNTYHEVGHVVNQLLKGNINFILGVLSPSVKIKSPEFIKLREIIIDNIPKNIYHSIHGAAVANYKKYILSNKEDTSKKRGTIARTLTFGIRVLDGQGISFLPATIWTEKNIESLIQTLDESHKFSALPETIPEKLLRDWLLKVRLS